MATTLTELALAIELAAKLSDTKDSTTVRTPGKAGGLFTPAVALTNGTAANKADRWLQNRSGTITSGNSTFLDLSEGETGFEPAGGLDLLGNGIALVEIVGIAIRSQSISAGVLRIGGEGTAAAFNAPFNGSNTTVIDLEPGGLWLLFAPTDPAYAVGAAFKLKLAAVGGNVTFDAFVKGRSA